MLASSIIGSAFINGCMKGKKIKLDGRWNLAESDGFRDGIRWNPTNPMESHGNVLESRRISADSESHTQNRAVRTHRQFLNKKSDLHADVTHTRLHAVVFISMQYRGVSRKFTGGTQELVKGCGSIDMGMAI